MPRWKERIRHWDMNGSLKEADCSLRWLKGTGSRNAEFKGPCNTGQYMLMLNFQVCNQRTKNPPAMKRAGLSVMP